MQKNKKDNEKRNSTPQDVSTHEILPVKVAGGAFEYIIVKNTGSKTVVKRFGGRKYYKEYDLAERVLGKIV